MNLTLLLDLDDTLLDNDINVFIPVYLKALARRLAQKVPAEKVPAQVLASTGKMIANRNPLRTLEETFDADFYAKLGVTRAEVEADIVDFYDNIFPTLSGLTRPRPAAIRLVEEALSRGARVVIATNPLFPWRAIYHRLRWAGLAPETHPFALITSYEQSHFCKPYPGYFAEILARLGWPEGPVAMVGNSFSDDLLPASRLNIPVYLIGEGVEMPSGLSPLTRAGDLDEVLPWLEQVAAMGTDQSPLPVDAYSPVLRSTVAALDNLCRSLPAERWKARPAPDEWCLTEILCHLRDADSEVNLPRYRSILTGENPFLPGIDLDALTQGKSYCEEEGPAALRSFAEKRMEWVSLLDALAPEDWDLPARHAIFGPTSLRELTGFAVTHDRTHIQQARATIGLG